MLTEAKQQELAAVYHGLNPALLLKQINENLECLWRLAEHPREPAKTESHNSSVTAINEATMLVR